MMNVVSVTKIAAVLDKERSNLVLYISSTRPLYLPGAERIATIDVSIGGGEPSNRAGVV